jgi:hypothetical protein
MHCTVRASTATFTIDLDIMGKMIGGPHHMVPGACCGTCRSGIVHPRNQRFGGSGAQIKNKR